MPRKPLAALAASVSALVVAGIGLAHGGPGSVQAASATFDAATVTDLHSGTCTGADGTYTRTKATYTGTSTSSDARLNGTLTVRAKTFYNATTNLGVVQGHFRVENADGHADGKFVAVDTNGSLDGFVGGAAKHDMGKLLGGFSSTRPPASAVVSSAPAARRTARSSPPATVAETTTSRARATARSTRNTPNTASTTGTARGKGSSSCRVARGRPSGCPRSFRPSKARREDAPARAAGDRP